MGKPRSAPFQMKFIATVLLVVVGGAPSCWVGDTSADPKPPSGYQCAPGKTNKGSGCTCPATHVEKRDAENTATCAAKPPDIKPAPKALAPKAPPPNPPLQPHVISTAGCPSGMVRVPAGTFTMGSADGGAAEERPAHPVTLGGYCVDTTEVTVAAYGACVAAKACTATTEPAKDGFDSLCNGKRTDRQNHPVNCVDWNQATAFCAWASKRLPTEAEWEYAARGRDGRTYPWGNEAPSAKRLNACGSECVAMVKRLSLSDVSPMYAENDGWEATAPVGSFPSGASPFGALDLAGNVWEWTADLYGAYAAGAATNPTGATSGAARVNRGGGWYDSGPDVRGALRGRDGPAGRDSGLGFRCARGD